MYSELEISFATGAFLPFEAPMVSLDDAQNENAREKGKNYIYQARSNNGKSGALHMPGDCKDVKAAISLLFEPEDTKENRGQQ